MSFNLAMRGRPASPPPATLPNGKPNTRENLNAYARSLINWEQHSSVDIGPIRIPEKLGIAAASIITVGAGAGAFGGAASGAETGSETVIADNFVGDLPLDPNAGDYSIADNYVGDIPTDPNAGAPSLPPGFSNALGAFGSKALDYALKRNLLNASNDAAKSNAARAPNQANVSPAYGDPWKHPAETQSSGGLNSIWTVALVGIALLLIVVFFMRSK